MRDMSTTSELETKRRVLQPWSLTPRQRFMWRVIQGMAVVIALVTAGGALSWPDIVLPVFWNLVLPLVPLSLLISPALWRGVCPLATLNMLTNQPSGRRRLVGHWAAWTSSVGILLLALLVPARRFLLNQNGLSFAGLVLITALAALVLGAMFDAKAGFCNALCPVLPVERLYGQAPLLNLGNPRCSTCQLCTPRGCLDLSAEKAIPQTLGPSRRSHAWLLTPFGAFAAVFPGFVVAYGTSRNGPLDAAGQVYLHFAAWSAASSVLVVAATLLLRLPARLVCALSAAVAAGCYYWFASPTILSTVGVASGNAILRGAFLSLVAFWCWRAIRVNNVPARSIS